MVVQGSELECFCFLSILRKDEILYIYFVFGSSFRFAGLNWNRLSNPFKSTKMREACVFLKTYSLRHFLRSIGSNGECFKSTRFDVSGARKLAMREQ